MTFQSNVTYHKGEYTGEQSHVIPINTARQTNIKLETKKATHLHPHILCILNNLTNNLS